MEKKSRRDHFLFPLSSVLVDRPYSNFIFERKINMARIWKTGKRKPETKPRLWNKRELENKTSNETSSAKKPRGLLHR